MMILIKIGVIASFQCFGQIYDVGQHQHNWKEISSVIITIIVWTCFLKKSLKKHKNLSRNDFLFFLIHEVIILLV